MDDTGTDCRTMLTDRRKPRKVKQRLIATTGLRLGSSQVVLSCQRSDQVLIRSEADILRPCAPGRPGPQNDKALKIR